MKQKPKILVLAHDQFGYSITKYKHCQYAQDEFDITYIGWDYDQPKITLPHVKVKYVDRKSNIIVRNLRLLSAFHTEIGQGYDVVFANYVRGISLVKLLNKNTKFIVHIDTLGVGFTTFGRWIFDTVLKTELKFFNHVALISHGISKKIGVRNYDILPLGGERFSNAPKRFDTLSLLYVGTLINRKVIACVKGFHQFIKLMEVNETDKPSFTIIGDSPFGELEEINRYIRSHKLEAYIHTTGYVHSDQLAPFFEKANIGVSFVPITPYFRHQPPTKTFEYLISGLAVIATATEANKEIVKPSVSELVSDNADSFCSGLLKMQQRLEEFDGDRIREEFQKHTWKNVVKEHFVPLIQRRIGNT